MTADVQLEQERAALPATVSATAERMRVLHVVSCLGIGGTEHGVLKVMNGLGAEAFDHRICAVRGIDDAFAARVNVTPQAYSAGTARPGFQFPLFRLMRIMKEFRPHVVHTRNFGALEAIPAARLAGVPVTIHSEHGYEIEILAGLPWRRRILSRAFYGLADAVFTVTRDLRTYYGKQTWLRPRNFRVIYNGVDTERFAPRPQDGETVREQSGIPSGRFVIGSVGRLVPIKDHKTLLQAAEQLVRAGVDVHVLLVGSGPEMARLQAYAASSNELSGRVLFTGASDRVPQMLNAMDVFILPSISEGMSNTLLEAMATGLPIIATRAGGNPEIVEDGQTGWLFAPSDVQALSAHLERLARDRALRSRFSESTRRRAIEQFSLATMIGRYRDLYFELVARRGAWKRMAVTN